MMKTSLILVLGAIAMGACSSPQSTARDAEDAQHDANETKAYANEEVRMKNAETQRNADAENRESSRVGEMKSDAAQGDANKAWAEAGASLSKARMEARDESEKKLAILDKQFADLKPKLVRKFSEAGAATMVKDLTARSTAVRQSIDALANATADSLEPVKSTIAQCLTDYDRAINEAKNKV
ncbi:MAG TPA: hypothetical protein PK156_38060 [Polyangium sp.]|nr:hypothetical protein [Polyangium sp.]